MADRAAGAARPYAAVVTEPAVPGDVAIEMPLGSRVLVVAGLRLGAEATAASEAMAADLAAAVDAADGPGLVVLAGDTFDDLVLDRAGLARATAAHPRLVAALRSFSVEGDRRVLVLPGPRDAMLLADPAAGEDVGQAMRASIASAVELEVATGRGPRRLRIVAARDERRSADHGLSTSDVVRAIAPGLDPRVHEDAERLSHPSLLGPFVASRLLYRRAARWSWLLAVPFVLGLLLKVPLTFALAGPLDRALGPWDHRLALLALTTVIDGVLVAVLVAAVLLRAWRGVAGSIPEPGGADDEALQAGHELLAAGCDGVVSGGPTASLQNLHDRVLATTGACGRVIQRRRGRWGLPPVFVPVQVLSWVEIEAGADLHVRLWHAVTDLPGASMAERMVGVAEADQPRRPQVVAAFPGSGSWPAVRAEVPHRRRVRRRGAFAIAAAGVLDVVSATTPPLQDRLHALHRVMPLGVPRAATALVALGGVALLALADAVRRGRRRAHLTAIAILVASSVLHIVKGIDVEETVVALALAGYLVAHRRDFAAEPSQPVGRTVVRLLGAVAVISATSTVGLEVATAARVDRLPISVAFLAVVGRMVGIRTTSLPRRLDQFASPALLAAGIACALWACWLLFRAKPARQATSDERGHARRLVERWGTGTLDYFALRDDKTYFVNGQTVIAYAVHLQVCLVSPDPVGPTWERERAWAAFRVFADRNGWTIAVLGAGSDWLPVYRDDGMRDLYVGDEAIVDVRHFSLEGGRHKGLRQAVNRVARSGYTIEFADPAVPPPGLEDQLRQVMGMSRRGDVERGFSMTLGRLFDPSDRGLLLAVCRDPAGRAVAFCQYVPAPGIGGYSLDLMRRDDGDHPNGLVDFVVVETIRHLAEQGARRLGLNFATMRAVLAGEVGAGLPSRVERWALQAMSGSMQIESLWRFNAKFDPQWQPRHLVYDTPEHLVGVAFAVAQAESFWEIPLLGRFLVPSERGLEGGGT
jgi:lysylphosphatidylglycerol synthetase-like protein (DUF2156 family)